MRTSQFALMRAQARICDCASRSLRTVRCLANVQYAYDSKNKRVWSSTLSGGNLTQTFYYYGADGQKLGIYPLTLAFNNTTPVMTDNSNVKLSTFFGSKRIGAYDRLGSAKYDEQNGGAMSFYPYGEGTVQPTDSLKFATYTRDSATGLDYADHRYYANNFGRFMSPDPNVGAWDPADPQSWNDYAYVANDPINFADPEGLVECGDLDVSGGGTVRDYLDAQSDAGKLIRFVWAEGGTLAASGGDQSALSFSMAMIAQAIENRLAVANGQVAVAGFDGNIYWTIR